MRLLDRILDRYRDGYWEGMASGAAVLMPLGSLDGRKEAPVRNLIAESQEAYATNGVVFACMVARLGLLAEAQFKFRDRSDGSLSDLPPRAEILENPWPNGTSRDLIAKAEQDVTLAGNFFLWKADDETLVRMAPWEMTIISELVTAPGGGQYKRVVGYDWDPSLNLPGAKPDPLAHHFTADEIVHWAPLPDPIAIFRGMSWLTPVLREVRADSGMTEYKTKYLDHGQPVAAIKYAQKFRPDTVDSVVDRIMAKYGGMANAFKPLVLDQGADPIMGGGLKELDYAAVQTVGEERICATANVPPEIIGLRDVPAESYQPAMRRFGDMFLRPQWRSLCGALEQLISVPSGQQLWFDTNGIAALQAAEVERAQAAQVHAAAILTLVQSGFERHSIIAAITSGDMSLLRPDPNAPTPGVNERETVTVADLGPPVTGPGAGTDSGTSGTSGKKVDSNTNGTTGNPPGGGQVLTKPQTPASKRPMPSTLPGRPTANGNAARPSPNRG